MRQYVIVAFVIVMLSGCVKSVNLSDIDVDSVVKVGKSAFKSFRSITPEQEYYIGRTVSAEILKNYRIFKNKQATLYLNQMGTLLSYASPRPETFGGYHFAILDSDEINAFAAPGGFIFVTRGLLRCTTSEDGIAAILAHEIAHVSHKHGLRSIKKSRMTQTLMLLGTEAAKQAGTQDAQRLARVFEDSVGDVVKTIVSRGYSRSYEEEADIEAAKILRKVGYNDGALIVMLAEMKKRLKPGGLDFMKTHPDPLDRIDAVKDTIVRADKKVQARAKRFARFMSRIR